MNVVGIENDGFGAEPELAVFNQNRGQSDQQKSKRDQQSGLLISLGSRCPGGCGPSLAQFDHVVR
jgi:hypothetical protein